MTTTTTYLYKININVLQPFDLEFLVIYWAARKKNVDIQGIIYFKKVVVYLFELVASLISCFLIVYANLCCPIVLSVCFY